MTHGILLSAFLILYSLTSCPASIPLGSRQYVWLGWQFMTFYSQFPFVERKRLWEPYIAEYP